MRTVSQRQLGILRKLKRKKYREQLGLFIAEGWHTLEQIAENKVLPIQEVYLTNDHIDSAEWQKLQRLGIPEDRCFVLSNSDAAEVSDTEQSSGWLATIQIPKPTELNSLIDAGVAAKGDEPEGSTRKIFIALDEIQDPGNLGTILRTAVWMGVEGVIFGKGCVDAWNPKVVRSTVGASGMIPYVSGELAELLPNFESKGWNIGILEGSDRAEPLSNPLEKGAFIWVVGNESRGISEEVRALGYKEYRIESTGKGVESLNAAMALGIALYRTVNFS
jgi:TrmH family RNA methyltransferase